MLLDHAFSLKSCIYFSKFLLMGFFLPFLVVRELALKVFHIYVVNFSSLRVKRIFIGIQNIIRLTAFLVLYIQNLTEKYFGRLQSFPKMLLAVGTPQTIFGPLLVPDVFFRGPETRMGAISPEGVDGFRVSVLRVTNPRPWTHLIPAPDEYLILLIGLI